MPSGFPLLAHMALFFVYVLVLTLHGACIDLHCKDIVVDIGIYLPLLVFHATHALPSMSSSGHLSEQIRGVRPHSCPTSWIDRSID